ncbi:unnamed protein product [Linum tenue]|nr:unnamed protein product [Linum tenue]
MIVWIQLPALKVHFYHREVLMSLGNLVGRTIKLDYHTINRQRRKFARLAVEIDMSKPLVPRIFLDDHWQKVVYENLPMVCFECGKVGHNSGSCSNLQQATTGGQLTIVGDQAPATQATVGEVDQPGFGPWMLVSKKSRRSSRDPAKKGKFEQDLGNGSQGQANKNGKGGNRFKDGDSTPSATTMTKIPVNQRPQELERKGNSIEKEGEIFVGRDNSKGKEIMREEKELGKGVLGSGPGQRESVKTGPRSKSELNKASTSAHSSASPTERLNQSASEGLVTESGPMMAKRSVPANQPPVQLVVGSNGTKMQIVSVPSSPKKNRQADSRSMTAAERTKPNKTYRRQSKKGATPVKLQASKALQIWSPVKDKKAKSRARLASLTLQEINAWTGAAAQTERSFEQGGSRPTQVDQPAAAGEAANAN